MRKRQEIRRIAASIMAAVMMVTAVPFGGAAYGNEVPGGGIANTEDTETLTASDSNGEYKKISDSDAEKPTVPEKVPEEQIALLSSGAISGSGLTEDDPLIITSATEWREVMTYVSGRGTYNQYGRLLKHIALGENISLNNETWYGVNLNGKTFDGRGHTISGIKQPLFGIADGTVKNLVVSDTAIKETSTGTPVGAIAGKTSGTLVIQNCYVNGKLSNANDAVGGLVGEVSGGTTSVEVQNCVVDAEIVNTGDYTNKSLAGGLIGHIPQFGTEITIEKCITLGTVEINKGRGAGGLVGGQNKTVMINRCAALQKRISTNAGAYYAGQLYGYYDSTINGSYNYVYAGMDGAFNKNAAANGTGVTEAEYLSAEFWNGTIGWADDASWVIEDTQLPILKTSGLDPEKQLTDGKLPVYLGGAKIQLSNPANVRWTGNGKAVWDAVENADGYQVQLYKNSVEYGPAETVSGQTSYDFTSKIKETGLYTFKVKAIGNENYETSDEEESAAYNFTAQSLADAKTAAENVLNEMSVTNGTTADEIFQAVEHVITNDSISVVWSDENGFKLTKATDGAETGVNGEIKGTIILMLQKAGEVAQTEKIIVNLTILPKFKVTFESGNEAAFGTVPKWENATEGTTVTLPENPFTVYGKKFSGWNDGSGIINGTEYQMPRRNVTFTAMWEDDVWDGSEKREPKRDTTGYYLIGSGAELAYFQDKDLGKAKLMCDINLDGYPFKAIEKVSEFDGCGHSIKGLNIVSGSKIYTGLFQILTNDNISIRNLNIENAKITYTRDTASPDIGILVGKVHYGKLSIENCFVSGVIEAGEKYKTDAGGLIGYVTDGSNVTIRSSYANARIQNAGSDSFVGGFIGLAGGIVKIENCYAIPDIRTGEHIGGFAGAGNGTVIRNSYAAGESLPTGIVAGDTSGLAEMGTIQNSVSIFSEMTSVNRISKGGTLSGNYGFVGTTASDKSGNILTPKTEDVGENRPYGADASETWLKSEEFYQDTLRWDFRDVWTMPSAENGYLFPVLKGQKESMIPTLSLDMDPAVISVSLDQQQATLYPRGSLKLTARVHSKNGASRDVKWVSSDPAAVHVTDDGTVAVHKDAAAGTYKVTAVSQFDESKQADCEITVDNREHTVIIAREDTKNSPNAEIGVYWSREDAEGASNASPVAEGKGTTDSPITFPAKAGSEIYLKFKDLAEKDVVNKITVTDKDGKTFEAKLCSIDPFIGHFTMPCGDVKIEVTYATDITYYQYTWFVGQDWGTWGTTATYTTTSWGNSDNVGSLKITNIINGKLFDDFDIKGISRYKGAPIDPKRVPDKASLTQNGMYYVDHSTEYPTLYVYLDGPGMISVNIEVKDDENASYNIVRKSGNSSYYTLDKTTAKAGETITATLTPAGVQWLKDNPTENAVFTYEGGLHVILFPPRFKQQADGSWTAALTMPACDIVTNVIFGAKKKAKIEGTDKEFTYDGNLHRIDEDVRASWGEYDISEDLRNQYEVIYSGINGTDYNSKVAPTDAGTYKCTVKISDDNTDYECDPITLTLTIKKAAMKTPDTPTAAGIGANTITLNPPTTFTDGTQIPELCGFEYRLGDGEWQDSAVFAGLLPDTDYHFYVRVKEGRNTEASEVSGVLDARTKTASEPVDPDKPNPDKPNPDKPNPDKPNPDKPDPDTPTPDDPTPSRPGTGSGGSSDDSDDSGEPAATNRTHSDGTWKKDQNGWWYELPDGRYVSGSHMTDLVSGTQSEQVAWRRISGAWWAFGADGYLKSGWIWDAAAGKWYYVDEKRGMLTGWYQDPQDGRWYYLDLTTGEMLTGWRQIPEWGYMYLNPFAETQTWFYDESSRMWIYDTENTRRPYGSLYMNEKTPDGYFVDENGVWKEKSLRHF